MFLDDTLMRLCLQEIVQISAWAVLHHVAEKVWSLEGSMEGDYERVVDRSQNLQLVHHTLHFPLADHPLFPQKLQGIQPRK
jgi:hypothetical protein